MVKVEAFKSLEASLAIRLGKRLKQLTHEDYRRVANAIEDGKWGLAEYTLNRITLNNFFKGQTEYVAYLTRMAMLFGASLVTSKPANTVVGLGYEDAIQVQMIHNFESLVLLKLTDTLKVFGLQLIANYKEAAIQKTESDAIQNLDSEYQVQKSNPYHDAGGRFTDKSHWVTGGATNENFSEEDKARLKSLKIPPAWVNVKLNPDTTAPLQAIGQDTKGRTQYIYSATHSEAAAAEKFARLEEFNRELPSIRAKLDKDILSTDIPKQQAAAVLYLIDKTGFRVGSTTDTKAKQQAYGASTLQGQHVKVSGNKVVFTFVGKKGVAITKVVKDKGLAKLITDANPQDNKPLFNASDVNVRDYLSSIAGKGFKVKDFRTWHGTFLALKEVASRPIPTTATAYKKMRNEVATVVADFLGNTPIVALSAYINPEVFKGWDNFVFKAESESDIEYMNRFFDTHRYDETKDWRKTPATEFDPDDNEEDDKILEKVQKFNPHHDEKGRFSSKDRAVTVSNDMLLYEGKYVAGLEKRHSNYDWKIISKAASEAHANILEQHPELSVIPVHLGDRIPKGHNTNGGCYAGTETGALPYVVLSAFHDDKLLECFDSENNLQMKGLPAWSVNALERLNVDKEGCLKGVFTHEYGHVLHWYAMNGPKAGEFDDELKATIHFAVQDPPRGVEYIARKLSSYSLTNAREFFSEIFAKTSRSDYKKGDLPEEFERLVSGTIEAAVVGFNWQKMLIALKSESIMPLKHVNIEPSAETIVKRVEALLKQNTIPVFATVKKANSTDRILLPFQTFMDANGKAYLDIVSSLHTSRVSAYGFTAECLAVGLEYYQWNAQLDGLLCKVCGFMHGKVFKVSDARDLLDRSVRTTDPEELKALQPWPSQTKDSFEAMQLMTTEELVVNGWASPPLHPRCRCLLARSGTVRPYTLPEPPQKYVDQTEVLIEKNVRRWAEYLKVTPDELKQDVTKQLQDLVGKSNSFVRVDNHALDKFLDAGNLYNSTGIAEIESFGSLNMKYFREKFEQGILGVDVKELIRPIYASTTLDDYGDLGRQFTLDNFGGVAIKLKDSTKINSTFNNNSMLSIMGESVPSTQLTPLIAPNYKSLNWSTVPGRNLKNINEVSLGNEVNYSEIQIYNGLSLDDIDEIVFAESPSQARVHVLKKKGISWSVMPTRLPIVYDDDIPDF